MIRARRGCSESAFEAAELRPMAFERRCAAVGCVLEAPAAPVVGSGMEDESAAREEEGVVTDES
jgi:hypothetical protein